jgi:hypothetical protein
MNSLVRILPLLLVTTLPVSALTEENFKQTRPAAAGGTLIVDVDFGTIEVKVGENDKVAVDAYRKIEASTKEREKQYVETVPITLATEGNKVVLRAHAADGSAMGSLCEGNSRTDARYTVHVPASFNADLKTAGGGVGASDLTGSIKAHTNGGDLAFARVHGAIEAKTNGGDITLGGCDGSLDVATNGGKIIAEAGTGTLRAHSSGGGIAVADFGGDTDVQTNGGRLLLQNNRGKMAGQTSGGSISAILPSPLPGDVSLQTSAGAIDLVAPLNTGLDLDAKTQIGAVTTDLPVSGARAERNAVAGKVNGGGKSVVLRTGAGSISIRSAASETAQR